MKKRILILVFSNLKNDARVQRQVRALENDYALTIACFEPEQEGKNIQIAFKPTPLTFLRKTITSFFLITRAFDRAYWLLHDYKHLKKTLGGKKYDLIIANDIEALPLAFHIQPDAKVLFDAHEFAPRHFEDRLMWRVFFQRFNIWLCKQYIPKVAAMTTVGHALAIEYEKYFGVRPTVITNASAYFDAAPKPVSDSVIRLIHHGIANRSRKLELMIELMDQLDDRFTLDLMLLIPGSASGGTHQFFQALQTQARKNPRIKFIPPVKTHEIVPVINSYDIGVFLLPPINFNYQNTLPNKLFDFIQARLAIAIGPTPEMASIVNRYNNGVVAQDFNPATLAKMLNALTQQDVVRMKANSNQAAAELNAEKNKTILLNLVGSLIS